MHARRQRALPAAFLGGRARLPIADDDAQDGQRQYGDADRLVQLVEREAPRAKAAERPAHGDLESEQGGDRPVQDDGGKAVTLRHGWSPTMSAQIMSSKQ